MNVDGVDFFGFELYAGYTLEFLSKSTFLPLCTLYTCLKNEYSTLAVLLYGETDDRNWNRPRGITIDGI
jgi:hypothetical protein